MSPQQGLSLAESVVAIFLLAGGAFVCLTIIESSARFAGQTRQALEATQLAERTLDAIRSWAYSPDNYFGAWTLYNDDLHNFPDFPSYSVRSQCLPRQAIYSLSSSLEHDYQAQARVKEEAYVPLRVTVSWGSRSLLCWAQIWAADRPARANEPVVIQRTSGPSDPIPFQGQVEWTAALYGDNDQPIPATAIQWQIIPHEDGGLVAGAALIEPGRGSLGRTARLLNQFYTGDPVLGLGPYAVPGWIRLRAEACYLGRSYSKESDPIELGP